MKVLFTIAGLDARHGGPSRSVPALAAELGRLGVTTELVAAKGVLSEDELRSYRGVKRCYLVPAARGKVGWAVAAARFSSAVSHIWADSAGLVLHDTGLWLPTNHAVAVAARHYGVPLVISPRGMLSPWALKNHRMRKWVAWWAFQRRDLRTARVLHATSRLEAGELRARGLAQPIAVVPNGVDVPEVEHGWGNGHSARNGARTVLFLSRIHPKKGLLNLIEAWGRMMEGGRGGAAGAGGKTNWRLVIAGGDSAGHQAAVEKAVCERGLNDSVRFVGPVRGEARWELYRSADLFVLPSYSENFGLVIAEALGCGVPVITTKATPWDELESCRCGWWIDVGVHPLIEALRAAMRLSDSARAEMGERGRSLIESKYAWRQMAAQMADVYAWVLGEGEKPGCVE